MPDTVAIHHAFVSLGYTEECQLQNNECAFADDGKKKQQQQQTEQQT